MLISRTSLGAVALAATLQVAPSSAETAVERGEYLFRAAGCQGCHTDVKNKGEPLAGGRAFKTPFGTFYSPNITPDPTHGIGAWSDADFIRALRNGVSPRREHYFPAFPYTAYTRMDPADMLAIKVYLFSRAPIARSNREHDLDFPFGWRFLTTFWKLMNFRPGPVEADATKSPEWNRGRYLVDALGHCGECHTPRDRLGGLETDKYLAGTAKGPDNEAVPNITPDRKTGIGAWSADDLDTLLTMGMMPDGDFVGGAMGEVVDNTAKLTSTDRKALITYLTAVKPIANETSKKKQPAGTD